MPKFNEEENIQIDKGITKLLPNKTLKVKKSLKEIFKNYLKKELPSKSSRKKNYEHHYLISLRTGTQLL